VIEWTPPRRPLIDPEGEISAAITQIDAGLTSRQRVQRTLGYDPDVIREERGEDIDEDKAAGLPPPAPRPGAAARPATAKGQPR
jgi:capsid protein